MLWNNFTYIAWSFLVIYVFINIITSLNSNYFLYITLIQISRDEFCELWILPSISFSILVESSSSSTFKSDSLLLFWCFFPIFNLLNNPIFRSFIEFFTICFLFRDFLIIKYKNLKNQWFIIIRELKRLRERTYFLYFDILLTLFVLFQWWTDFWLSVECIFTSSANLLWLKLLQIFTIGVLHSKFSIDVFSSFA